MPKKTKWNSCVWKKSSYKADCKAKEVFSREREAEGENEERQNDDARIDGNPDVISSTGVACECGWSSLVKQIKEQSNSVFKAEIFGIKRRGLVGGRKKSFGLGENNDKQRKNIEQSKNDSVTFPWRHRILLRKNRWMLWYSIYSTARFFWGFCLQ